MSIPESDNNYLNVLPKRAFVIGEETRICELVSLILEDMGFQSMQIGQVEMLDEKAKKTDPELVVWDLSQEKELSPYNSFSQVIEQASMKKVKFMLLGGPEVKKVVETSKGDVDVHFCLKPFSPTKFRDVIAQLYRVGN